MNQPRRVADSSACLAAATAKTARDVGALVRPMSVADETNAAAMAK